MGRLRTTITIGRTGAPHLIHRWLMLTYGVAERSDRPHPAVAARMLDAAHASLMVNPLVAAAVGDVSAMRGMGLLDPARIRERIEWRCPDCNTVIACPPLCAVTHSSLVLLPRFAADIRQAAGALLAAGADPDARWDVAGYSLSALYGAAGKHHDTELTRMLLDAGADPNDNESLYHATESSDPGCLQMLLDHGAVVEGTNAVHHQLDHDGLDSLALLLRHCKMPIDTASTLGSPLLWAIRRRRSAAHVRALLDAGASPRARTADDVSAFVLALRYGLDDVAVLLRERGASEDLSVADQFVAACASANLAGAREILDRVPNVIQTLSAMQLRQLPELAAAGADEAVRVMVTLGWPIAVTGGDWNASALNLAVFRGDAWLTRILLEHGASWTERHGFGDDVSGTLSWATRNNDPSRGDWIGCAKALVEFGMPVPSTDRTFSDEVRDFFDERRDAAAR